MADKNNVSAYRWVILLAIIPIIISTETMWLSLAPISSIAEKYYGVSSMSIALFSMSYMIMFIIFSMPASYVVDRFGYRYSLIIGAVITAAFGLVRAVFADNFTIVLISQFIIAIGQPFLLNISTKVPANWFPVNERSTAAGLLTMAQYIGFVVPMAAAPTLALNSGIPKTLMIFALMGLISAVTAVIFTKEKPAVSPPGPVYQKEELSLLSIKKLMSNKPYMLVLLISFISMGIFNTILTLIETILLPRGITSVEAGIVGAIFVISGVIGAVLLPVISDKSGVRIPLFIGGISLLVPVYLGFTYAGSFILVSAIAGIAGFTIMGLAPILFQHGSEVAYPISEGTSLGLILLMGQISGALFVYLFEALIKASGSVIIPMLLVAAVTALEVPFTFFMKESGLITKANK